MTEQLLLHFTSLLGFSGGSDCKESAHNAEDMGLIPESGRSPGEGNGSSLQHSCLEKPGRLQSMGSQSQTQLHSYHFDVQGVI